MEKHFIFGYGSLINKKSRQGTSPSAFSAIPVKVKNHTRGWFARTGVKGLSTTFLGCLRNDSDFLNENTKSPFVNGVLYEVNKDELPILDKREKRYIRTKIEYNDIEPYQSELPKEISVWVYTNEFNDENEFLNSLPNKEFPIIQSYVDLCISGCYEIETEFDKAKEERFSEQFITSTTNWNKYWANDRIYARRPHVYCPNAYEIDEQLCTLIPSTIFNAIYIE
ncbi:MULTISPECIES: gamma-glutamylcyclotransferase family protein [unclassified Croceitalea]|uniref:gamma-glutamylcyclotransferase family protein n=1 Tax=unclassified Croceitalea TaxID=2632280 RepID=UPI0030DC967C